MDKEFKENPVIAYEELKKQNTLFRRELKTYHCREKFGERCTCAFKCLGNEFCNRAEERIAELKAENERLKKDKIGLHSEIKQLEQENYGLNQELLGYKKGVQASEIIELKQTLQEIKEIVSKIIDGHIRPYGDYNQLKQILDLITKAEEE